MTQVQPVSTTHEELQPSPLSRFASSHPSSPTTYPSPQVSVQDEGVVADNPEQVYPISTLQAEEHPSPLLVFPSSQSYAPNEYPFPQVS